MVVVNHEESERRLDGLYLDSLINDLFLAYVGSLRLLNPIFYSLADDVLTVCMGVASMSREALSSVSFQKNGPRTQHLFLHYYCGRTPI